MKKDYLMMIFTSMIVMFLLPWAAISFAKPDMGLIVFLVLFYIVNPLYSIVMGKWCSKDIKRLWSIPIVSSIMYLLGAWINFEMGEQTFVLYAAVYMVIGIIAMFASKRKSDKNYNEDDVTN